MGYYTRYKLTVPDNQAVFPTAFYKVVASLALEGKLSRKSLKDSLKLDGTPHGLTVSGRSPITDEKLTEYIKDSGVLSNDGEAVTVTNAPLLLKRTQDEQKSLKDKIKADIEQLLDYAPFEGEPIKWYNIEEDCTKVSKMNPNVLFYVDGEGEEAGDIWRCFFFNGQKERHNQQKWVPPEKPTMIR